MSKLLKKAILGGKLGGKGESNGERHRGESENGSGSSSSSKEKRPSAVNQNDEEVARALSKELNAGYDEPDASTEHQSTYSAYPDEIENSITHVQKFAKDALSTTCYECEAPLVETLDVEYWIRRWKKGGFSTGVRCRQCDAITCLGCADEARVGSAKHMGEFDGTKLDWCCYKGGAFVAWVLLCRYDHMELNLQARSQQLQPTAKRDRKNGVGFGANIRSHPGAMEGAWVNGPYEYRVPGLKQALNFKQVDNTTDGVTSWVYGMLVTLLPKREETTKKVSPALAAMIELSLLQDRTAELLRNDSLQDVDKRADLYFATFAFVDRLFHHPSLDHLVKEDRFSRKQSAGLHAISTDWKGKGITKAPTSLIVAHRSEGMASSLAACLTNLATQSKVLLSGSHNKAAGEDILEIAEPNAVTRRPDVAKHLCAYSASKAREIMNTPKNRMARLVTETSEMTTSLPENVFVTIDEVRPDIMKALIIGPKGTPYESGLFEFDIVCPENYPAAPPSVQIVTTGQGRIKFNPNLYANGKVCLSLLGTWPGGPETKWQPYKSTIASVLVSIQAMILVEWPLENEPQLDGMHKMAGGIRQCLAYNRRLRKDTLMYAILEWLVQPTKRNGHWKDVVNDYVRFCGRGLVERARVVEKEYQVARKKVRGLDDGMVGVSSKEIEKLIGEIEKAIKQYVK
ncbi:MAG: hypothetical protein Q9226_004152 [Calogaya cf. arnoldii]